MAEPIARPGRGPLAVLLVGLLGSAVLVIAVASMLFLPPPLGRPELGEAIDARIERLSPGETFDLREVANFDWDRVVVLRAYASNEDARRALGFEWNDADRLASATSDNWAPMIIVAENQVVAWCLLTSVDAIPGRLYQPGVALARAEAVFTIIVRGDGVAELVPVIR